MIKYLLFFSSAFSALSASSALLWSCSAKSQPMSKTESEADRLTAYESYPTALYPVSIKKKWGFMNRKGDLIIQPTFDAAEDFSDGLAVAMITKEDQSRYGYIDEKGNWAIAPDFDGALPFAEDKAAVKKGELWGFIDRTGKEIIPCQFEHAGNFGEGRAAVEKNRWVGFIDSTGTMVIEPKYTCSVQHPRFVNGLAPVFGADEKTGFIDPSGAWKIEPIFHSAGRFVNGLAWAMFQKDDPAAQYGFKIRGGYINTEGEYVIQSQWEFGWDFHEGYAVVWKLSDDRQKKLWFVLDTTGNAILQDLTYRNVGAMSSGLIPIQNEDMEWGFMNIQGEEIIKPKYTGINHFKNGIARMETGSAFNPDPVYINTRGELVWEE
jgi:hypothetical protein